MAFNHANPSLRLWTDKFTDSALKVIDTDKKQAHTKFSLTAGIHADGWPVWFIQDFRQGGQMIKQVLDADAVPRDSRPVMSRDEYERMKSDNERKKQEQQKLQKENELILRDKAFDFFHSDSVNQNVDAVNHHAYMLKKQVILPPNSNCYAGIDDKGNLVFSLFDSDFMNIKLPHRFSLQFISQDSQKWFYKGISIKGICYPIRQFTSNTLFITEGIATAFSLDEFTHRKFSVIAALNCGNLLDVCKNLLLLTSKINKSLSPLTMTRTKPEKMPQKKLLMLVTLTATECRLS